MSDKRDVKADDVFNETDDDHIQCVLQVHADRDPPVDMCQIMKREGEGGAVASCA